MKYAIAGVLQLRADQLSEQKLTALIQTHQAELRNLLTARRKLRAQRANSLRQLYFQHKQKQIVLAKNAGLTQASVSRIVSDITHSK